MKSTLFFTDAFKDAEAKIKDFLNAQKEFLSGNTVKSTRAAGDAIQDILSRPQNPRKAWMLELCDTLFEFYPREIAKITDRIEHFKSVRAFWEKKPG